MFNELTMIKFNNDNVCNIYNERKLSSSKRITDDYRRINDYLMCNITHNIIIESAVGIRFS